MTLALLGWGAAPASAGGPTSALLVSPESGRTTGLYYSDREYGQLDSLLQAGTLGKPPEDARAERQISVTWLIHDTSPWRIDRIYPVTDGTDVWVHQTMNITEPTKGSWYRVPQPDRLRALLTDLDMLGKVAPGDVSSPFSLREVYETAADAAVAPGAAQSTEPADTAAPAPREQASGAGDRTDWWWALPGAAAGAALALVLRPFAVRLPFSGVRGEPGPRQELRDV
ncbi:hypothetical protein AB0I00_37045 [Streptomyces sp. NPDC050803]|uniref:hypothetical protein n=1 Tax=unclassified Streptomyces TaxID=2593676 RepID=UPI0034267C89